MLGAKARNRCFLPQETWRQIIIFHTYVRVAMGTRDKENSPFKLKVICSGIDLDNIYSYSLSFSTSYSSLPPPTKPAHHRNQPAYNPSTTQPSIRFILTPLPLYPIPLREISSSTKKKRKREKEQRDVVSCCCRSAGCAAAVRPAHEPRTDAAVRLVRRVSLSPPMFGNGGGWRLTDT